MNQKEITKYIDHTNVRPDATSSDIKKLCFEAIKYGFHSVCVTPFRVIDARKYLGSIKKSKVELICVVGFPFGVVKADEKINEAKTAKKDGATEIDMIINIGAVKEENWKYIGKEISDITKAIKPLGLKVIMEIGFLSKKELIQACKIAVTCGAKFVKTSTGYGPRTPTPEDIKIMKQAVGNNFSVKASGGIHDFETAVKMINSGATRIGTSSSLQIIGVTRPLKQKEKE